jgi:hypothetical protein
LGGVEAICLGMKTLSSFVLFAALAAAACGGSIGVHPITRPGDAPPADPEKKESEAAPDPVAPIAPYTGNVGTNDVSILYPLPATGESKEHLLRPMDNGLHGALLSKATFIAAVPSDRLERTSTLYPSGHADLALVGLRLDHCSARKGTGTCTSEVRAVFQAIYEKTEDTGDGDPSTGTAAQDGGVHVIYDVGEAELIVMMKQILTLRKAHGDLTSTRLEVHPILAQQGLGGGFAKGLRDIILEHVGESRTARVTVFDHNMDPDSDGWRFEIFDRVNGQMVAGKIPTLTGNADIVAGTSALHGPIGDSAAFESGTASKDDVSALVNSGRPEKGTPEVATVLQPAFENALRIQNPTLHNAETTDCVNCHLAEGAHLIAENVYAMKATTQFTAPGGTNYQSDRLSVTNLHAFGYLHRRVSIMQRTANESTVVRDWMDQKVK